MNVVTSDNIEIDSCEMNDNLLINDYTRKYLICFNPTNAIYQTGIYNEFTNIKNINSIILFNFRGSGNSTGYPISQYDLVKDGISQIERLFKKNVNPKNIFLYGWSLGGSIATKVASFYQNKNITLGGLIVDRTFGDVTNIIKKIPFFGEIGVHLARFLDFNIDISYNYINLNIPKLCIYLENDKIINEGCLSLVLKENNLINNIILIKDKKIRHITPLGTLFRKKIGCYEIKLNEDNNITEKFYPNIQEKIEDFIEKSIENI